MIKVATTSVDETRSVGAALAALAHPGDVVLLSGELGAGKTAFAQGFGAGLGVAERITSPTFTLARHYQGRLELHHIDVYRLDHLTEVFDVGLPELLDEGGVTLIEWGDVIVPALPSDYLEVRLAFPAPAGDDGTAATEATDGTDVPDGADDRRTLTLRPVGHRWSARQRAVRDALAPWSAPC